MPARSAILAALLLVLVGGDAVADKSAEDRAEELNDQGKSLFAEQKFEEALGKFRQALVLSAQGKYYFNVCFTLSQLQRYQEAITACEAVSSAGGDDKLLAKTDTLLGNLRAQVQQSGGGGQTDTGGGDAGAGDGGSGAVGTGDGDTGQSGTAGVAPAGGTTGPGGVGPMPAAMAQAAAAPRHDYQWSLGAQVFGLNNVSIGGSGPGKIYGDGGAQVRVSGDLVLDHQRRLGAQAYLAYSILPERLIDRLSDLAIIDLGIAGNWHIPLTQRFYLTPLVGAHLSFQGPADSPEVFVAVGGRAEVSFDWVIDEGGRHAVSALAGVNVYSRAGGDSNGFTAADYGLDSGGVTAVVGLGYTFRFQTPLGEFPVITLE